MVVALRRVLEAVTEVVMQVVMLAVVNQVRATIKRVDASVWLAAVSLPWLEEA
jgi:hypothetical protein